MKKAIIAMSGGVDSSVAALLTKESGDECIGATMKLYNNEDIGVHREKTCCSLDDVEDARSVAYQMDMPYYVFNFTADFHTEVMDRFVDAYENGCTPNPCIDCNRYLKFDKMFHRMQEIGYDYIVTGHYARVEYDEKRDRYLLKKAVDDTKDQSYVLYMLTQEQLALMLGVSRQSVTKWEAEKSYPEMDKLLKLCQIFDVTLDDLVQGDLTTSVPTAAVQARAAVLREAAGGPPQDCVRLR